MYNFLLASLYIIDVPNPFHQLPILEKDGVPLVQSGAISNYLAMEFGNERALSDIFLTLN